MKRIFIFLLFSVFIQFARGQTTGTIYDLSKSFDTTKVKNLVVKGKLVQTNPTFTVTHIPQMNETIPAGDPYTQVLALFNQELPATVYLAGGYSYERRRAGNFTATLTGYYGKQSNTGNILSCSITGNSQTYNKFTSQPAVNTNVNFSQSVTVPYNVNTTFTNTVATAKGAVTYSTIFSVYDLKYAGFDANPLVSGLPAQADILAATYQNVSGYFPVIDLNENQQGSDKYYFFITTGTVSNIQVNGTPSNLLFNMNVPITFTNASGGTYNGYCTVSKVPFGSNSGGNHITMN
jgi:hypothetical protein